MKHRVEFACGVTLIIGAVAALLWFVLRVAFRVYSDLQHYRGTFVQIDVTLDETAGLIALVGLAISSLIAGAAMIRRSRETNAVERLIPS